MARTILHVDLNNFYASVECLYHPELRGKPVAVSGDVENRHGIILAKNQLAKAAGVKTGETIWQAKEMPRPRLSAAGLSQYPGSPGWPERFMPTIPTKSRVLELTRRGSMSRDRQRCLAMA